MRTALLLVLVLSGCKRGPQPTVPQIPDSARIAAGGNLDLPEAVVFHTVYRYTGHAGQAHAFYEPEMARRGVSRQGDIYAGNMTHSGGFGSLGSASPVDPQKPGVWLNVMELPEDTRIDVWENVPRP